MPNAFWQVAVEAPIREPLTYSAPAELAPALAAGLRVDVPLGKRKVKGVLLGPGEKPEGFETKPIAAIDDEYAALPPKHLEWMNWVSQYYIHPIGQVTTLAYPPLKRAEKERKSKRPPVVPAFVDHAPHTLTEEQEKVVADILGKPGFQPHLLFGVTGSGKTEVYLQLFEKVLAAGKTGLFLVPEISLTPQMVHRFSARFPDQIAVLHSGLTDRERTNQWWDIVEGRKKILLGARSALFCPIRNLGMIVVDEEHEPSFKQDEKLKYHGRDSAVMLAKISDCPVILGSATPSLETWAHARSGRYTLHRLTKRVQNRSLPEIQVVDLREDEEKREEKLPSWLSQALYEKLVSTYEAGKQSALFLNRRGLAPIVLCESCGFVHECPNCDISLTLHHHSHLICHYCDYHENYKESCPSCKEGEMKPVGLGTEQVESDIARLFPEARVARADRDEIQTRTDLEDLITQMESGEIDFLVGTQMIAKGLDFPKLQTVGLVLADIGFNIPDFRSPERSFQLMTQVSGRAGRHVKPGESPGQVVIQTYNPDHPSLVAACKHDYENFAAQELAIREELLYPPFGRLAGLRIQGPQLDRLNEACSLVAGRAASLVSLHENYAAIEVLGPSEAPLARLRNQYRFQMLLKAKDPRWLNKFCYQLLSDESWIPAGVKISIDVDPLHLL
ncbi:MAG: primosomal protein N' [Bdellovibrionaceae bacterium]|nr:primosomal protein N' [Pseudobdellovibrionaceae bacterium]